MKRDYRLYCDDILEAIIKIEEYSGSLSFDKFIVNTQTMDAVIRNLEIIGEAVRHLPKIFKDKYANIPWKEISGMRDKLIHEYFGVDEQVLWKTIRDDLPLLKSKIREILQKEET